MRTALFLNYQLGCALKGDRRGRAFAPCKSGLLNQGGGCLGIVLQAQRRDKPLDHRLEIRLPLGLFQAANQRITIAEGGS